ncbi:GGDEF domain-containing protein [Roseibium sp.]|uniref:GGDEF domain-containing protein n=1 Tax=Roseibium sp. TaxID=1936156 RepID=UPI003A988341
MTLDTLTLFTCVTVANIAGSMVLCLLVLANRSQPRESRHSCITWAFAMLAVGIGCTLVGLRGNLSDIWSIFISNALLLVGHGLRPMAITMFQRKRVGFMWFPLVAAAGWFALYSVPPLRDSFIARVIYVQGLLLSAVLVSIWITLRHNRKQLISARILAGAMALEGLSYCYFTYHQVMAGSTNFLDAFQTSFMSIYLVIILTAMVLITMMVAAMSIEDVQKQYQTDARLDPVTGLANRRAFEQDMQKALRGDPDKPIPYALAVVEVDNFEGLQETYGQVMGDTLLKLFSRICRDSLPAKGLAARIGEKQFALFLPGKNDTSSCALATGIARTFTTASRQASGGRMIVTLSTGVFAGDARTSRARAQEIADRCLVRAKAKGRNRVEVNEEEESVPLRSVSIKPPFSTNHRSAA